MAEKQCAEGRTYQAWLFSALKKYHVEWKSSFTEISCKGTYITVCEQIQASRSILQSASVPEPMV